MPRPCAGLGDDVDDAGGISAVLSGEVVGDDAEFLHRFRIRRGISGAAQACRVVAAVELEVDRSDLRFLRAVDRRQLFGTAERVRVVVARHAAGGIEQRVEIAIDQRQVQHFILIDASRQRRRCGIDERRIANDRYRLRDVTGFDGRVDAGVAAHLEHDARLRKCLEAGERDVDFVVAERQQSQRVLTRLVGDRIARGLRIDVGRRHRRAGHRASRGISDVAENGAGRHLRMKRSGKHQRRDERGSDRVSGHAKSS